MWYQKVNRKTVIIGVLALCLLAVVAGTLIHAGALQEGQLHLQLNGEAVILLAPGESYEDPGASAVLDDGGSQLTVPVETSGTVKTDQLGTYLIKYKASYKNTVVTAYRSVRVADMVAPQILLTEKEDGFTLPGQPYIEEGFTATDDQDGDITHRVRRSEKDGVVTYAVADRAGNKAFAQRQIRYKDPEPPKITLSGNMVVALKVGEAYREPGYRATDNLDGDVTGSVTVTGSVDTQKPGTYTLKYQAKDRFGNQATAERIVCVLPQGGIGSVEPNGKVIYLTFDDGPGPQTGRLLDILAKYNIKATFFVVNTGNIATVSRIAKEGHTVAIHSATHKFSQIYVSEEAYFNDLYTMQSIVEKHTGQKPTLIRFPGGTSNTVSKQYNKGIMTRLTKLVTERGFRYFDWNVDSKDAGGAKTPEEVFANVINGIGNKSVSVVLQHDLYGYSVDAVEQIILWGLANGYTFAPLSEGSPSCQHSPNN